MEDGDGGGLGDMECSKAEMRVHTSEVWTSPC